MHDLLHSSDECESCAEIRQDLQALGQILLNWLDDDFKGVEKDEDGEYSWRGEGGYWCLLTREMNMGGTPTLTLDGKIEITDEQFVSVNRLLDGMKNAKR